MKIGEWIKWKPNTNIPKKVNLESLIDNKEGLMLTFTDKHNRDNLIYVFFKGSVLSYRNTDEGNLLQTFYCLSQMYDDEFYTQWSFFKIKNSSYIRWFNKESYKKYKGCNIEHYIFITPNDIIEVLSTYCPEVTVMKK
ncbi:hypothetical protein [Orenia marismortui]|uniref:Uncharacterized protein n=1 Tax=Orenia marismortui TaxID=46469 RepID=A0A4R8H7U9_9FIRM|nr:hypothetical protein [Orenia marismortui]TDX51133.1 hypothetical protein C7959_1159 [Orenia marismortui]